MAAATETTTTTRRGRKPKTPAPAPVEPNLITLPVIRGIQSGYEYYTCMMSVRDLARLLRVNERAAERKAPNANDFNSIVQRSINAIRVNKLVAYVLKGLEASLTKSISKDFYILAGITVVFDPGSEYAFETLAEGVDFGYLKLDEDTKFFVSDGQHRASALEKALTLNRELGDETIPVALYINRGNRFLQQVFLDLNQYVVKPPAGLFIGLDHRDTYADLTREVVRRLSFTDRFAVEANSIGKGEKYLLFPLKGFYQACNLYLGGITLLDDPDAYHRTVRFWEAVAQAMPIWQEALQSDDARELRETTLALHLVAVKGIARAGRTLRELYGPDRLPDGTEPERHYLQALDGLATLDWGRSNEVWEEVGVTQFGRLLVSQETEKAIAVLVEDACTAHWKTLYPDQPKK